MGIRYLRSEALEYRGIGSSVVRSAAQLALGVFAIILAMLPPTMVRAASWSTGFEIDREAGLAMLRDCQTEAGVFAPVSALTQRLRSASHCRSSVRFMDTHASP